MLILPPPYLLLLIFFLFKPRGGPEWILTVGGTFIPVLQLRLIPLFIIFCYTLNYKI